MLGKAQYPNLDQLRTQVTEAQATYTYINPDQLPLFNNVAVAENIFTLGVTCKNSKLNKMLKLETIRNAIGAKWPKDAERNLYAYNAGIEFTSGARA
jgi:hypothetical protein